MNFWQGENWNVKVMYSKAGVATQILISTLECDILVDVGDGTLRDLMELDYDFERLKAIAITHGHFDHVGGLWTLLGFLRMIGRTSDLFLIAPRSCSEVRNLVEGFMAVYSDTMPFRVVLKELSNEEKITIGRMDVQAFSVIHRGSIKVYGIGKRIPALGYSISYNKQRIVISSDTGMCQSLKKFVKDADLAILEATAKEKTAKNLEVHLSIEEVAEIGKTAKDFILIHQWSA
ncbi:MAG: ribonuclease Z [Candidatus Bathyarchaeia archaeon]|nr:ribonuclease Z [Candidatus Bathyarchaeia archaeon]